MTETVVVGAGVIGLTAALALAEKGHKVKIVAHHFPNDPLSPKYTSHWAGAHYRPAPASTAKEVEDQKLTRVTLRWFEKIAKKYPESSIQFIEGVDLVETKGRYGATATGYFEDLEEFRVLSPNELPKNVEFGASYKTWVLNAPLYVQFLQRKLTFEYGVEFVKLEVFSLKQVAQLYPGAVIVNASGLGLQYDGGYDSDSFRIRGQTLLIKPPKNNPYFNKTVTHQGKDGSWTFVISRPLDGGFILGGTKQIEDPDISPKEDDTKEIIKRAKVLFPELFNNGELDIRFVNVGFRPARKNGVRVELEKRDGIKIVHAYGAGGMGFELSRGVAEKVLSLVEKSSKESKL